MPSREEARDLAEKLGISPAAAMKRLQRGQVSVKSEDTEEDLSTEGNTELSTVTGLSDATVDSLSGPSDKPSRVRFVEINGKQQEQYKLESGEWINIRRRDKEGNKTWDDEEVFGPAPECTLIATDGREFQGRGVPLNGMVLIDKGYGELAMVSIDQFKARLDWVCPHRLAGWACKVCLEGEEVRQVVKRK